MSVLPDRINCLKLSLIRVNKLDQAFKDHTENSQLSAVFTDCSSLMDIKHGVSVNNA